MASPVEVAVMRRALELAAKPPGRLSPNPRVGAVLVAPDGQIVAEGVHRGAGTPHAEVDALQRAGAAADGATAVVTLEPCDHTGRTGPCSAALAKAGVRRVVYAMADPNPAAAGGAGTLRRRGVDVEAGVLAAQAAHLNHHWSFAVAHGRPFVTWKLATTLDGRSGAADGTSAWITGPEARRDVHRLRARVDAIIVGTGTVLADDPRLTVRDGAGKPAPVRDQPVRVVVGTSDIPDSAQVWDDSAETVQIRTHDPAVVLRALYDRDVRFACLEGGPRLAGAFLEAGLVDEVVAYVAPALLGSGRAALEGGGVATITDAHRLRLDDVSMLGRDLRLTASPVPAEAA
jgi:diaminohydroxyphosphoribosylaminopyrimidine deaminase/5-amino-6-(5-phosphoribosylamino)uracil reductase